MKCGINRVLILGRKLYLVEHRESKGFNSQNSFSKACNINITTYRDLEIKSDTSMIKYDQIVSIAKALGLGHVEELEYLPNEYENEVTQLENQLKEKDQIIIEKNRELLDLQSKYIKLQSKNEELTTSTKERLDHLERLYEIVRPTKE